MNNDDLIDEILNKLVNKRDLLYNDYLTTEHDKLYYRGQYESVSSCIQEIKRIKEMIN